MIGLPDSSEGNYEEALWMDLRGCSKRDQQDVPQLDVTGAAGLRMKSYSTDHIDSKLLLQLAPLINNDQKSSEFVISYSDARLDPVAAE
jgi:hypothetical protein